MTDRGTQVQEIKDAIDIVDLVSQYTTLAPAGKRMKGLSPFTNEKTPSFFVDPDEGVYYCFSSQKGGDVFTFVQETEGVDFKEALKILAERAGISLVSARSGVRDDTAVLYHLLESAAGVYQKNITGAVRTYLLSRGISEQFIQEWGIGYAPDTWHTLCTKGMSHLDEQVKVGMCVRGEKSVYDRFRNRVQFPFYDERGRVIGFSGRMFGDGEGAKYINSPESPLFNKSTFLYGLHKAKPHIRKHNVALLTEGPIDAIMVHQAGYPMAVATSGTAVTEKHLQILQRLSNRLLIVFDGDAAGNRAALRVIEMAFKLSIDSKVVVLPAGSDPADVICNDVRVFKTAVKEALSATAFLTHYVSGVYGADGEDCIRGVKEVVLPIIAVSKDSLMQEYAVQEVASFCGLPVDAVRGSLAQIRGSLSVREDATSKRRAVVSVASADGDPDTRVQCLITIAAHALAFLEDCNVTPDVQCVGLFQEAQQGFGFSGVVDKKVAVVRYEECFPGTQARIQGAQDDLRRTTNRLSLELKRRAALRKSKGVLADQG